MSQVHTQVDVRKHPVLELRLHVRRQEVHQQLAVAELWMLQESLHTNTSEPELKACRLHSDTGCTTNPKLLRL